MSDSLKTYPLPYPFPDGRVWAAIRNGIVVNMVYMDHLPDDMEFQAYRQQSRGALAKEGEVWTGAVKTGRFVPQFESRDVRHTSKLNAAREVRA
ncbi:hypothetical protein GALL_71600 [mine drainage metagenome]|uniref:Uncharacterized protein n=1 Tax=mine drainage metagenome TaxID=410659 RepID=A0A1J5T404_9ZZZZ